MTSLFDPIKAGDLVLKNRIAMAPLTRARSPNATPNDLNVVYYRQRSTAGLIVSEGTAISQQGQGNIDVPGLYEKAQLAGWKKVTDAVHEAGGKIVAQLWHTGRISHSSLQPAGKPPVAPSALQAKARTYIKDKNGQGEFVQTSTPRALDASEIPGIIDDYRKAARNAVDIAGFDGVEIHSANGYLLDQFLRSESNHRTDEFGGSIENRCRFPLLVAEAVAKEIGGGRTGIRISPVTPANDAHDPDPQPLFDFYVDALAAYELAFIHLIEGATGGDRNYTEADYAFDYKRLKHVYRDAGGNGAWMVNNGYTAEMAEKAVGSGYADIVSFGRPFIANPDLVRRIKEHAPWNEVDQTTLYGGNEKGYTDYPTLG
ncbi:alkene reductase [Bartonella apis]|uniref:alkene reductase n=1 Tax=Bartonella apis TaxID=1686310 RepID=UPI00095F0569|nr:alkene reductase [Bartonella apis]OLY48984.1 N-ethylmaleimide reductase [Bartonella apis]